MNVRTKIMVALMSLLLMLGTISAVAIAWFGEQSAEKSQDEANDTVVSTVTSSAVTMESIIDESNTTMSQNVETARAAIIDMVLNATMARAQTAAMQISRFLESTVKDALIISTFDRSNLTQLRDNYLDFANSRTGVLWHNRGSANDPEPVIIERLLYSEVSYVNASGMEQVKVEGNIGARENSTLVNISVPANTHYKSEDYYEQTRTLLEGEVYFSHLTGWLVTKDDYLGEAEDYDDVRGDANTAYVGIYRIATPVYDGDSFDGMVVLSLNHSHVEELVRHITPRFDEHYVLQPLEATDEYASLIDNEGWLINHPKGHYRRALYIDNGTLTHWKEKPDHKQYPKNYFHDDEEELRIITSIVGGQDGMVEKTDPSSGMEFKIFAPILFDHGVYRDRNITSPGGVQFNGAGGIFGGVIIGGSTRYFEVPADRMALMNLARIENLSKTAGTHYSSSQEAAAQDIEDMRTDIDEINHRMLMGVIAVLAVAIIIAMVLGFFISDSITTPLRDLTNAANEVKEGNLDREVEILTRDEIGELASTFEEMRIGIKERTIKLEKARSELEEKVNERTAELTKTNEALRNEIVNHKKTEESLRESKERYHALFEHANDAIFMMREDRFIDCNAKTLDIFGCTAKQIIDQPPYRFSPANQPDGRDSREKALEKIYLALQGEAQRFEWRHIRYDGTPFEAEVSLNRIDLSGQIFLQAVVRDITKRKQAENLIRAQHDLALQIGAAGGLDEALRICLEYSIRISGMDCGGIYLVDGDSGALDLVYQEGLPRAFAESSAHYDADSPNMRLVMAGKPVYTLHQELGVPLDNSHRREHLRAAAIVPVAHEGRVIACINVASHTLDEVPVFARTALETIAGQIGESILRVRAEEQIRASLKEKTILLKEVHHRVKNNLQIISSLLDLQSDTIENQEAIRILEVSQDRIRSMALIHEQLYQSDDLARIDINDYIQSLVDQLQVSYDLYTVDLEMEVMTDEISMNLDTAIPCGLLINEMVSNALKHAFPDEWIQQQRGAGDDGAREMPTGRIRVELREGKDGDYHLAVKDNGIGIDKDIDFKTAETLGLQLIFMLTQQLNGSVEVLRDQGAEFRITFKQRGSSKVGE